MDKPLWRGVWLGRGQDTGGETRGGEGVEPHRDEAPCEET